MNRERPRGRQRRASSGVAPGSNGYMFPPNLSGQRSQKLGTFSGMPRHRADADDRGGDIGYAPPRHPRPACVVHRED